MEKTQPFCLLSTLVPLRAVRCWASLQASLVSEFVTGVEDEAVYGDCFIGGLLMKWVDMDVPGDDFTGGCGRALSTVGEVEGVV